MGIKYFLKRLYLHIGNLYRLSEGNNSYSVWSTCNGLAKIWCASLRTDCSYSDSRDKYSFLPMVFIAIFNKSASLDFTWIVRLPNHTVMPYLIILYNCLNKYMVFCSTPKILRLRRKYNLCCTREQIASTRISQLSLSSIWIPRHLQEHTCILEFHYKVSRITIWTLVGIQSTSLWNTCANTFQLW